MIERGKSILGVARCVAELLLEPDKEILICSATKESAADFIAQVKKELGVAERDFNFVIKTLED